MVICLERGADLHTAQLMPLPLTVSCFSKIQTGFCLSVTDSPVCVCVCVHCTGQFAGAEQQSAETRRQRASSLQSPASAATRLPPFAASAASAAASSAGSAARSLGGHRARCDHRQRQDGQPAAVSARRPRRLVTECHKPPLRRALRVVPA